MDLLKLDASLTRYVRPDSFPLAIRLLRSDESLPDRVKVPSRDLGMQVATCQAFAIARRYGWSLAVGREDLNCPLTKTVFGFERELDYFCDGNLCAGMYTETKEAGAKTEAETAKLEYGEFSTIVAAPLARTTFDPHVVLLYGNSAQIMMMVAAALYRRGGRITSSFSGRIDCSDSVIATHQSQLPQVILPCYGDRVFGQAQDHEMAFAFPQAWIDDIVAGLQGVHKGGVRYPIPAFLRYQPQYPADYEKLNQMWDEDSEAEGE